MAQPPSSKGRVASPPPSLPDGPPTEGLPEASEAGASGAPASVTASGTRVTPGTGAPAPAQSRGVPEPSPSHRAAAAAAAAASKRPRAKRCPTCAQAFSGEARFCPFDGDALVDAPDWNPSADPLIGATVDGRYEVISVIGEGGMGTVYEVRHTTLGRRFALKVLRRDLADAEHSARFVQEAKAAAAIGHPNIVAVTDFGEVKVGLEGAPAVPYFVMEYLTGISLASLLRAEKTLEPVRAAEIVLQCAAGLSAAHAAGVVHRDLKPDNVFLTRNGEREFVKLLDFGVAKMVGAGRLTRAGMVFGTPHYMSPEQAEGKSVDHRADVYALGVILYEALAGRVPFEADTYMGVLTKHMFATPEPIERVVPDAAALGTLGPIVMRCLSKSPHDRYPSMAELVAALELSLLDAGVPRIGLRSERPRAGRRVVSDAPSASTTPGLRPVMGPLGLGLSGLALGLVVVMGVREIRGARGEVGPAPTASVTALAGSPSSASPAFASGTAVVEAVSTQAGAVASAAPAALRAPVTTAPVPPSSAVPVALPPATAQPGAAGTPTAAGTAASPRSPRGTGAGRGKKAGQTGGDVVDPWKR